MEEYAAKDLLNYLDIILPPFYILTILLIFLLIQKRNIKKNPAYKYFTLGVMAKIIGAISVCMIYCYYYISGDTAAYFHDAACLDKLLYKDWKSYLTIFLNNGQIEYYSFFDKETGFPEYLLNSHAFSMVKITQLVIIFSCRSFVNTAILLAVVSYAGIWKLYLLFCKLYPQLIKEFAISVLFIPSVVFWGSGILKDTVTVSALCWYTVAFYKTFIIKKKMVSNFFVIILSAYFIMIIKPYIFVAVLPGSIIWAYSSQMKNVYNKTIKVLIAPFFMAISLASIYFLYTNLAENLGSYSSIDNIVIRAKETQRDFVSNTTYGTNKFDIGEFDGSFFGIIAKFPMAVSAGLFRPFIWESRNIVMIIAGLENFCLMMFSIYLVYKTGLKVILQSIRREPIVFFSFIFSISFAFSVGLTTANFGAMVRYKIPAMPFYLSGLFILNHVYQLSKRKVVTYHGNRIINMKPV